jgi:hypothetical protein
MRRYHRIRQARAVLSSSLRRCPERSFVGFLGENTSGGLSCLTADPCLFYMGRSGG